MRFIVVTCCALVVVKSASIRDRFIVTPQNLSSPGENFIFSSQKVKIITQPGQALRPLAQNVKAINKFRAEEVIYTGLNSIRNKIESGNDKLSNDFWQSLNNSVQELVKKHKNSNDLGSEFQNIIQEKVKNQQNFGQSVINFFTEGVSNILNNLGGAPQQSPVSSTPQTPEPLDDVEIDTTQKPNFLSNVVNSVQQAFQTPQRPQQTQSQQAQSQVSVQPQPVKLPTSNQPGQEKPSTQRPNFLSNVVNSVQQAFKPPQQAQPQQNSPQETQSQVPVQPVQQPLNNQPIYDAPTTTHRPNFLSNVANSVQQAFKPPQQAQSQQQIQLQVPIQPVQPSPNHQTVDDASTSTQSSYFLSNVVNSVQQAFKPPQQAQPQQVPVQQNQVPVQQAQLQVLIQAVQPSPNNQPIFQDVTTSTQRPNFLSNVVNSVQQAFQPSQQAQLQQIPQKVPAQTSIPTTQLPFFTQPTATERPGFLSNVVGQVQQAFQRPQQMTQPPQFQQTEAVVAETTTSASPGFIQGAINQVVDNFRPNPSTPPLYFVEVPTTTTTTQNSLLQNIGQVIQGFRPQTQPTPAPPQIQETPAATTLAPNIFQNIGQAIQGFRPTQTTTTSTAAPQPNQVQQVVASSSQVPSSQNNNLQNAIAEVAACIVKTRIDNLVEQSKHKVSGEL